jgi:hypothetical protein
MYNLKTKPHYYIIALLLVIACKQEAPAPVAPINTAPEPEAPSMLYISSFTDLPAEIDSCSSLFSNDSLDYSQQKYIYVDDYAKTSFLKVNGVLTKFIEVSHVDIDSLNFTATYKSDDYEMNINAKQIRKVDLESFTKTGTIKLSDKTGKTLEKTFYGECGC